jgi:hypothetical protein
MALRRPEIDTERQMTMSESDPTSGTPDLDQVLAVPLPSEERPIHESWPQAAIDALHGIDDLTERRDALARKLHAAYCGDECELSVVLSPPWQPTGWQEWATALLDAETATPTESEPEQPTKIEHVHVSISETSTFRLVGFEGTTEHVWDLTESAMWDILEAANRR